MEISKDLFELVPEEEKNKSEIPRPSISYWQDVWRVLKKK